MLTQSGDIAIPGKYLHVLVSLLMGVMCWRFLQVYKFMTIYSIMQKSDYKGLQSILTVITRTVFKITINYNYTAARPTCKQPMYKLPFVFEMSM